MRALASQFCEVDANRRGKKHRPENKKCENDAFEKVSVVGFNMIKLKMNVLNFRRRFTGLSTVDWRAVKSNGRGESFSSFNSTNRQLSVI